MPVMFCDKWCRALGQVDTVTIGQSILDEAVDLDIILQMSWLFSPT